MANLTLVQAINLALIQEMEKDDSDLLLSEDIGINGGVFRATEGLHQRFGGDRVVDTPLAESGIVGTSIGLAMGGLRPVAEIQFEGFLGPAYDQITNQAARISNRTRGQLTCPLVLRVPVGGGIHAPEHHSDSPEAIYTHTPGLKVIAPATPYDAKGLLKAAIRDNNPVISLEHKKTYRLVRGEVPEEEYVLPIGKADIKRSGESITIVSYGLVLHYCLEAAEQVSQEDIDVEVVDLRTLTPLDKETVLKSVKKTGRLLIVHEDNLTGGVGAEVAAIAAAEAFEYLDAPISRLCGPDVPTMPFAETLENAYMPSTEKVAEALRKLAAY